MANLRSLGGLIILTAIAWFLCRQRKKIRFKTVLTGFGLQFIFALAVLKTEAGRRFFEVMNNVVIGLLGFSEEGARFLFGNLVENEVPVIAASNAAEGAEMVASVGASFAFNVLPTIIFFSALMSVMYYFGLMQKVVELFARIMMKFMGTSGAESLSASANIFVGQTEAPLVIAPYVGTMTNSELLAVMAGGMATVAGGVMAAYVGLLHNYFPGIAGHLLTASVMSAPAALVMAKLILPETGSPKTSGSVKIEYRKKEANVLEAIASGTSTGLKLAFNVGAMLISFLALLALLNWILGWAGGLLYSAGLNWSFLQDISIQRILGWIFSPLAYMMGIAWEEAAKAGQLLGLKIAVNEFVAFMSLTQSVSAGELSARTVAILSYALCGFANFLSIGIQIGGIGAIAPERKSDLAKLGVKALIAGALASFTTAAIAGILIG